MRFAIGVMVVVALAGGAGTPAHADGPVGDAEASSGVRAFAAVDGWARVDASPGDDGPRRATLVVAPETAPPGGVVRVVTQGSSFERVEVRNGEETIATSGSLKVRMTGLVELGVYLIGLGSTVSPGSYELVGLNPEGVVEYRAPFTVAPREFVRTEIPLDRRLTSIRADPDPRKTEETRILSMIVLSRDPTALYHPGRLLWPLPEETRISSRYGDRRVFLYSDGSRASAIHYGLDFAAPAGTPIRTAGSGAVRFARDRIVTGKTVAIEHLPGVFTLYYHLDELVVAEGEVIRAGEVIGSVGSTGLSTGPHLHWEVRVNGVPVSPPETTRQPLIVDARGR